jgi:spermidine synthase
MSILSKLRGRRREPGEPSVEVSERDGLRSLHLGSSTVQSTMRVDDPVELVLSYTRAMMAFLLFHPKPRDVAMIGLGGGSLAKFVYHRLPEARVTVVENSARVITAARSWFEVPEDDGRFEVLHADGAEYVRAHPEASDVLMVDAYDSDAQVEALATEAFYADARAALRRDGVLTVNLWSSDPRFDSYLQRIERAFDSRVVCLPAERRGNVAVFAFVRSPEVTAWDALRQRARQLEKAYGLEFLRFVGRLTEMNPHTERRLIV